jgi:pimeloyl-ACP methyl ester carboxylesterase
VTTFVLVHGAWHGAWCWDHLAAELASRGASSVAVDVPCDDTTAGCAAYAAVVIDAIRDVRDDTVLVGHSLGGLTIPLVAASRPVRSMVFLCALIPQPGASLVEQLEAEPGMFTAGFGNALARDNQGRSYWPDADAAISALYVDCPHGMAKAAVRRLRPQARLPNIELCPLSAWPKTPSQSILTQSDAAISPAWSRRAAADRLGATAHELPGDHSPFMSRPADLARLLIETAR